MPSQPCSVPASHSGEVLSASALLQTKSACMPSSMPNVDSTVGTCVGDMEGLLRHMEFDAAPVVDLSQLGKLTPLGAGEYCIISSCALDGARVAVKRLKPEKHFDPIAVSDLARETRLLAKMRHENIISVVAHGMYYTDMFSSPDGQLKPFLCLEILDSTLSVQLPSSKTTSSIWAKKLAARAWPLLRSIDVAVQIARAMRYCHDEWVPGYRLLHRDLKPNNIGFTSSGRVVIFDFGLCKLWPSRKGAAGEYDSDDLRQLTGLTGSLRYMAPEVALCQPYNHKADVFSFASVLFEMVSFEKPFYWCTPEDFMSKVCNEGRRCKVPATVPTNISDLIQRCWSPLPSARPEFSDIVRVLEAAHAAAVSPRGKSSRPLSNPVAFVGKSSRTPSTSSTSSRSADSSCPDSLDTTTKGTEAGGSAPAATPRPTPQQRPRSYVAVSGVKKPGLFRSIFS